MSKSEENQASRLPWRDIWQVPALVVAVLLLAGGLAAAKFTAPRADYGMMLDRVETLLAQDDYTEALGLLNTKIYPYVSRDGFAQVHRARFHLLRARGLYYGQRAMGISRQDNNENIIGEFLNAERLDAVMNTRDLFGIADTYIALGEIDRALDRMDMIANRDRELHNLLVRRMVIANLSRPVPDEEGTLSLLAGYVADNAALTPDERAWAEARTAELLIKRGYARDAIAKLLRAMPRSQHASRRAIGELFLLLGEAYLQESDVTSAAEQLDRAMQSLSPDDLLYGRAAMRRASVHMLNNDPAAARDQYSAVLKAFSDPKIALPAMLGLAEVEASQFEDDAAIEVYKQLTDGLGITRGEVSVTAEDVSRSLLRWYRDRMDGDDFAEARRYALMAEEAHGGMEQSPPAVLLAIGHANQRVAQQTLEAAGVSGDVLWAIAEADAASREQARRLLMGAGRYFRAYADRMVLIDNTEYADALWLAGVAFDAAGRRADAIRAFGEYADGFMNDPRRAEARFRLAQAHQAEGDYGTAADLYEELIADRIDEQHGQGVGPFAVRSYVPLAQCYLLDTDESNDERAEQLLQRVIGGEIGTPDAPEFRSAVLELGRFRILKGRYAKAVELLEQALVLYEGSVEAVRIRYKLADSYRRAARTVERRLDQARILGVREQLEQERAALLESAMALFERVRDELSAQADDLIPLEKTYLRNARFYLGDCAYDLGRYIEAISYYSAARDRNPSDPASLVALIQIVNAYRELGEYQSARTANERALRFFHSLPSAVWDDSNLPMGVQDWERWLDSSYQLSLTDDESGG